MQALDLLLPTAYGPFRPHMRGSYSLSLFLTGNGGLKVEGSAAWKAAHGIVPPAWNVVGTHSFKETHRCR